MAAYINLLINAMFNATFGGRPDCSYLMLIALVVISTQLLRMSEWPSPAPATQQRLAPLVASPVRASRLNRVPWLN
jgi:hypothetical protein